MKEFDSLIREMDLVDPSLCNASFTWTNFRVVPICCRLDRFLFSNNWAAGFEFCRQEAEATMVSDHCPVILDICPTKWGLAPFRCENAWVEHKYFKRDFDKWWKEVSVYGWEGH
ncbi:Endonuclease/exonuclease/phosphatase, partial [Trema orientale]